MSMLKLFYKYKKKKSFTYSQAFFTRMHEQNMSYTSLLEGTRCTSLGHTWHTAPQPSSAGAALPGSGSNSEKSRAKTEHFSPKNREKHNFPYFMLNYLMPIFHQYSNFILKHCLCQSWLWRWSLVFYFYISHHGRVKIWLFQSFSEKIRANLALQFKMLWIQSKLWKSRAYYRHCSCTRALAGWKFWPCLPSGTCCPALIIICSFQTKMVLLRPFNTSS